MFPRHHQTEKTTTPWWKNDGYLVHVPLKLARLVSSNLTIRRYTPMCRRLFSVIYLSETFSRSCGVLPQGHFLRAQRDR